MKFLLFTLCAIYLSIAGVECQHTLAFTHTEIQRPIWGDVTPPYYVQVKESKIRVPFITRCSTFEYPSDAATEGQAKVVSPLRGIAHINLVDKKDTECEDPDVTIKEGNFEGSSAKVKVCSKSGCPLDSVVNFYTKRQ